MLQHLRRTDRPSDDLSNVARSMMLGGADGTERSVQLKILVHELSCAISANSRALAQQPQLP